MSYKIACCLYAIATLFRYLEGENFKAISVLINISAGGVFLICMLDDAGAFDLIKEILHRQPANPTRNQNFQG